MQSEVVAVANPGIWAETGGITGLVIFALLFIICLILYFFGKNLPGVLNGHREDVARIMNMHSEQIAKIHDLHAQEREKWGEITDERQKETNAAIQGMTAAMHEMTLAVNECFLSQNSKKQ